MNESTLSRLKILVEQAVRPVRASASCKRKMREELLAHVTSSFEEEVARLGDEQPALERTVQRFGNPVELTGQLQGSVPMLDSIERFADGVFFRPGESTPRRAVRYALICAVGAFLFLFAICLLLRGQVGELPIEVLWLTCPVVLISGWLGFTIVVLESSLRRSLGARKRRSWLLFTLVLAGSTSVAMTLGFFTYGVSLKSASWLLVFTAGLPVVLAWTLAPAFTTRKREHDEWASLQIE
jgi:hypothetical protein